MLDKLDAVPWASLEHAYGSAEDVPGLLRKLLDPDPKVRSNTLWTLYGNVYHQGSRYPATPYVVPFLVEMCARHDVPNRSDLLRLWGNLITGYFSVQERPVLGGRKPNLCLRRGTTGRGKRPIHCRVTQDLSGVPKGTRPSL